LTIRKAIPGDIPALASLHATAWRETYEALYNSPDFNWPTARLREQQWRQAFQQPGTDWFCFVIENEAGELVGFAKGKEYNEDEPPGFTGELNKLYLLRRYHHQGLGRQLLATVAREFISRGITSMLLFSEPANPSGQFFEALGAKKILAPDGAFHGAYGWVDLALLT